MRGSMSTESIGSPPSPGNMSTLATIHRNLLAMHAWCVDAREQVLAELANNNQECPSLPEAQAIPNQSVYAGQPTAVHYSHLVFMRRTRKLWDAIVADHEDSWDSAVCVGRRISLIGYVATVLNEIWVSPEVIEQRDEAAKRNATSNGMFVIIGTMRKARSALDEEEEETGPDDRR